MLVEEGVVSTVHCRLFMCCGACFSVVCVLSCCAVLLCCGMAGGACLPLLSVFLFLFFVLVFGVVRAQPSEHARYPRTPWCLLFFSLSLPLLAFLRASLFLLLWNGGVCVYHVFVCCVGMTAMGSLSLSSSFFW